MFKCSWNSFIQYMTIICYFSMGKLWLKTVNSSIFIYTCCAILTCIIHVFSEDATYIQSFYRFSIDVFVWMLIFTSYHLGISILDL